MGKNIKSVSSFDSKLEIRSLIGANPGLPTRINGVQIKFIENPKGFLSVVIPVEWTSTHDQIRSSIDLALKWRDRIIEFQLPAEFPKRTELLLKMNEMRIKGGTYKAIAREFNLGIDRHIKNYAEFYRAAQDAFFSDPNPDFQSWFNTYSLSEQPVEVLEKMNRVLGATKAAELLKALHFSEAQIKEYIHKRIIEILRGLIDPPMDYPLDGPRTASILRSWMKTKEFKAFEKLAARLQQARFRQEKRSIKDQKRFVAAYLGLGNKANGVKRWDLEKLRRPLDP